jgi:hypothetical protein
MYARPWFFNKHDNINRGNKNIEKKKKVADLYLFLLLFFFCVIKHENLNII